MKHVSKTASAVIALGIAIATTGCAAVDDPQHVPIPPSEREYATGSNMPKRVRRPASEQERLKAQEDAQAMRDAAGNLPRKDP